jgi:aldehyde dehydrogenase (NAD+)
VSASPDVASRELVSIDPATLDPLGRVPVTPPEELAEVIAEARLAQAAFAREPLDARRRLLERVVHALVENADTIALTISAESGKPLAEAYAHDLVVSADALRWHAENLGPALREERVRFPQLVLRQKRGSIHYEPLGVVGIVSPWNFPLAIPLRQAAAAVAAGNAAIVKPSELTPLSGAWVEELFRRAGAPPGLVRVVQGAGDVGEALVRHRGVAGVVFTGSVEVGRAVAQAAAERLCPAVLELGGKDAMIVLDDADLDRAVEGVLASAFSNAGQRCAAASRVVVFDAVYDELRARLLAGVDRLEPPGPVISEASMERILAALAAARDAGATLVRGGERLGTAGWHVAPTLVEGVAPDAPLSCEELFGPVAALYRVGGLDEAVAVVNASPYGLTAAIHTASVHRAMRFAELVAAGVVVVNAGTHGSEPHMGFGGVKQSGTGWKEAGVEALDVYSETQYVNLVVDPALA